MVRQNPGGIRKPERANRSSEAALPPTRAGSAAPPSSHSIIVWDARADEVAMLGGPRMSFMTGAGPTGLTLAIDLARRGVDLRIVDAAAAPLTGSRGDGLQPRTLEVFDDLGVLDEVLESFSADGRPLRASLALSLARPQIAPYAFRAP